MALRLLAAAVLRGNDARLPFPAGTILE